VKSTYRAVMLLVVLALFAACHTGDEGGGPNWVVGGENPPATPIPSDEPPPDGTNVLTLANVITVMKVIRLTPGDGLDPDAGVTLKVGQKYSASITASGGTGKGFKFTAENLPKGFSLTPMRSEVTGFKAHVAGKAAEVGENNVTVTAKDLGGIGGSAKLSFIMRVVSEDEDDNEPAEEDPCKDPVKIRIVSFSNNAENEFDSHTGKGSVMPGSKTTIGFAASGGKPGYQWSWQSRVKKTLHCITNASKYPMVGGFAFASTGQCGPHLDAEPDLDQAGFPHPRVVEEGRLRPAHNADSGRSRGARPGRAGRRRHPVHAGR
jgi:hypothetical protein